MRKLALFMLIGALLLAAPLASAETVQLTLVSVGPGSAGGPNSGGGVYVYPYYFSVNGSNTLTPMICDDYNHEVTVGESWTAKVSRFSDLSQTAFKDQGKYMQAAWLVDQLGKVPTQAQAVAINFAIWSLFSSNVQPPAGYAAAIQTWLTTAAASIGDVPQGYWDQFVIYTPTNWASNCGMPQEFIAKVPEPGVLAMLMLGLIPLLSFRRRLA